MTFKRLVLLAIIFSFCSITYAQNFQLGLKASPLVGYFKTETQNYQNEGAKLGFSYGLLLDRNFTDNYALATEFSVTTIKGAYQFDSAGVIGDYENTTQYIEIPIALKLKTAEIGYFTYFGSFGLGNAFKIKAKQTSTVVDGNVTTTVTDKDISSSTAFYRAALNIGIGTEYSLSGNTKFLAGLLFSNGFLDTAKEENKNDPDFKLTSSYIALNLGVLF
jgi:hypothetical protein